MEERERELVYRYWGTCDDQVTCGIIQQLGLSAEHERGVVFFRDQDLTTEKQVELFQHYGKSTWGSE